MRNLHAPRARVIIHFKDGGVNDDMRSGADWRGEEHEEDERGGKRGSAGRDFHLNSSTIDGPHE